MKATEVVITARRVVEEITIRISRPVDRPEPCGPDAIDVTPGPRRIAKKRTTLMLVASRRAA